MVDRAIIRRKIDQLEGHLRRIRQLPELAKEEFIKNDTVQDVLLFNLIQSIQNCIDMAAHIVSDHGWGMPGSQREAFDILKDRDVISAELAESLVSMVGFRNRIVHEYDRINLEVVYDVWQKRIRDIDEFCLAVMDKFGL